MSVPTSNPSLLDVYAEFGGSGQPLASFGAGGSFVPPGTSGIHGAVPSIGSPVDILVFAGTSNAIATYDLTVGADPPEYGFDDVQSIGTMDPDVWFQDGLAFLALSYNSGFVSLVLYGNPSAGNSGWTNLNVNGTNYTRASATYTPGGGNSSWTWASGSNPFGTTPGVDITVIVS